MAENSPKIQVTEATVELSLAKNIQVHGKNAKPNETKEMWRTPRMALKATVPEGVSGSEALSELTGMIKEELNEYYDSTK